MADRRTRRLGAYALLVALGLSQAGCGAVLLGAAGAGAGYVAGNHYASERAEERAEQRAEAEPAKVSPADAPQTAEAPRSADTETATAD
ncbi:hypothetical protein SAMN05216241_10519 [Limimonas halophila]|uniref:Uncharacterized protein n=1 Tax=Limimonas halophila TaxID=1082479 RepID=A0A1G7R9N2_9PROT|nr:hypothetical protein [Limimonas halophila]SDG06690.1 hypothetical protein SAMN05216241_10519 [Limimonas halophila]